MRHHGASVSVSFTLNRSQSTMRLSTQEFHRWLRAPSSIWLADSLAALGEVDDEVVEENLPEIDNAAKEEAVRIITALGRATFRSRHLSHSGRRNRHTLQVAASAKFRSHSPWVTEGRRSATPAWAEEADALIMTFPRIFPMVSSWSSWAN